MLEIELTRADVNSDTSTDPRLTEDLTSLVDGIARVVVALRGLMWTPLPHTCVVEEVANNSNA